MASLRESNYHALNQAEALELASASNFGPPIYQEQSWPRLPNIRRHDGYQQFNRQDSPRRKPVSSVHVDSFTNLAPSKDYAILDKPQPRSGCWSSMINVLNDSWIWEVFGLLGSGLTLLAMVVLLKQYENKQQPSWTAVSLNTVVASLSTLSRLLISIPLSGAIGQLKWTWFADRKRNLADLSVFDSASRGVLGSIALLWTTRSRHIVALGAVATILAVGFGPSNQALLHYTQENIVDLENYALLANTSIYDSYGPLEGGSFMYIDPVLKANMYNSLFNPNGYQTWGLPQYFCYSVNCTWDPVASLEARSLCTDITPQLQRSCDSETGRCNLTIPNGVSTWYYIPSIASGGAQAMILEEPTTPLVYTNASAPSVLLLQSIMAIGLNSSEGGAMTQAISNDTEWIATECSLELHVRSVNASVRKSIYQETTLGTWSDVHFPKADPSTLIPSSIYTDNIYWMFNVPENLRLGVSKNDVFAIGYYGYSSIRNNLRQSFNGTITGVSDSLQFGVPGTISSDILQTIFVQDFTNCATPKHKLTCAMSNVASAMSKTFRDSTLTMVIAAGANATANSDPNRANMAVGRTSMSATFVVVRWQWLSLPVLIWMLAAITMLSTAMRTRAEKLQKWRNDILPLLFLYREAGPAEGKDAADEGAGGLAASKMAFNSKAQSELIEARLVVRQNYAKLS